MGVGLARSLQDLRQLTLSGLQWPRDGALFLGGSGPPESPFPSNRPIGIDHITRDLGKLL